MIKMINEPDDILRDMLEGYLFLYKDHFEHIEGTLGGLKKRHMKEKVSVVIGGGAGNEPWCLGYVGEGLADGVASGNVYTAPPAKSILDVSRAVYNKKGILYIGTNHMGDVLNFELVGELAELDNIRTKCVFVNDDIASDLKMKENRRGVAGIALAVKIAGAASEMGLDLEDTARITQKAIDNTRTISVTSSAGYMPANGKAMFEMPEGAVEYGMGFNGEPGILREPFLSARHTVETMMDMLLEDMEYEPSQEAVVLLNGYGFTTLLELCIVMKEIKDYAEKKNLRIYHGDMREVFCPQGTGGFSISVMRIDEELKPYYNHRAHSPFYKREQI